MTKLEQKLYDHKYYIENKLNRQVQMDAWEEQHPGNKKLRNQRNYLNRKKRGYYNGYSRRSSKF